MIITDDGFDDIVVTELKKEFSGSVDYLSGVNDGMYKIIQFLNNDESVPKEVRDRIYERIDIIKNDTHAG